MRINGWFRLGIVASVLWILIAGVGYEAWEHGDAKEKAWEYTYKGCLDSRGGVTTPGLPATCVAEAKREVASVSHHWKRSLTRAFGVLAYVWVFVLIATFTVRWVRRGFQQKPS